MTKFLVSDDNKTGFGFEEILMILREDIIFRCYKVVDDHWPTTLHVLDNNMNILGLLSEAIKLASNSTETFNQSFGPSTSSDGGEPRIGTS
ncbi:MAG: hypothetical protein QGG84_12570 [Rhodospirillales bacterium]|nr:hypothetical protein [Rhodospirillales bacterium]